MNNTDDLEYAYELLSDYVAAIEQSKLERLESQLKLRAKLREMNRAEWSNRPRAERTLADCFPSNLFTTVEGGEDQSQPHKFSISIDGATYVIPARILSSNYGTSIYVWSKRTDHWVRTYKDYVEYFTIAGYLPESVGDHFAKSDDDLRKDIHKWATKYLEDLKESLRDICGDNIQIAADVYGKRQAKTDRNRSSSTFFKGDKGTAEIWSTLSGGYNIQVLHERVYVKKVA